MGNVGPIMVISMALALCGLIICRSGLEGPRRSSRRRPRARCGG